MAAVASSATVVVAKLVSEWHKSERARGGCGVIIAAAVAVQRLFATKVTSMGKLSSNVGQRKG